jgi:regulator of nucleoside diphosphate kinase
VVLFSVVRPHRVRLSLALRITQVTTEQSMADLPPIYLTQSDLDRLVRLVETQPGRQLEKLEGELVRANVVPRDKIPQDVVTMNSRVVFENETTSERREITLVYPANADIDAGRISVLVPVGTALLGLRVGQWIDWELPGGKMQRYRIVEVPFQPEAAGAPG